MTILFVFDKLYFMMGGFALMYKRQYSHYEDCILNIIRKFKRSQSLINKSFQTKLKPFYGKPAKAAIKPEQLAVRKSPFKVSIVSVGL